MPHSATRSSLLDLTARALAALLGSFALVNLAGELYLHGFDVNLWWLDLRGQPAGVRSAWMLGAGLALVGFAARPFAARWRRVATAGILGASALAAAWNAATYWRLLADGTLFDGPLLPYSALLAPLMTTLAWRALVARPRSGGPRRVVAAGLFALELGAFTTLACLVLMLTFGRTDYRRPADAVVVFGARAYADGTPSLTLEDRTRTGCRLVLDGYAKRIVFSGGPGDGAFHETEVMRRIALEMGLAKAAVILDERGHSTADTAAHTSALFEELGLRRVLAVSHAYHLPRIQLAYRRRGVEVFTVPAEETRPLGRLPWFMTREVAALLVYWARPLIG